MQQNYQGHRKKIDVSQKTLRKVLCKQKGRFFVYFLQSCKGVLNAIKIVCGLERN